MNSSTEEFYIQTEEGMQGPFDLLSIIRKIKNGRLTSLSMITLDPYEAPTPASSHPVIREVLEEQERELLQNSPEIDADVTLLRSVKAGWQFIQLNPYSTILTGVFGMIILTGVLLISSLTGGMIQGILCAIWGYFFFNIFMISLCLRTRMQLVNMDFYQRLAKRWKPLALASLLGASVPGILPAMLYPLIGKAALLLMFVPGALWASYFLFIPLIISDRNMELKEALALNATKFKEAGVDYYSVIFGLLAANIIIPLPPVTMPIFLGAACEAYDKVFNEY